MWNIRKAVNKGDYNYAVCYEHPKANEHGYVLYHRVVAENTIGRLLKDNEIVHHINHDKKDNRPENLEVMLARDHGRLHNKTGRTMVEFTCPNCSRQFLKEKRQIKKNTQPKCSRKCNGEFSRRLQLGMPG